MARIPKAKPENFLGTWCLAGFTREQCDVALPHYTHTTAQMQHFAQSRREARDLPSAAGLTLVIADDRSFVETGASAVPWYAADGVLHDGAVPFDGSFIGPLTVRSSSVEPGAFHGRRLRYDDGDTRISDSFDWHPKKSRGPAKGPERLIRTVTAITDEQSVDRLIYVYHRAE